MSQLIDIDPSMKIPPEDQGCKFGCYLFDQLPPISTEKVCQKDNILVITITNIETLTLRTLEVMLIGSLPFSMVNIIR